MGRLIDKCTTTNRLKLSTSKMSSFNVSRLLGNQIVPHFVPLHYVSTHQISLLDTSVDTEQLPACVSVCVTADWLVGERAG